MHVPSCCFANLLFFCRSRCRRRRRCLCSLIFLPIIIISLLSQVIDSWLSKKKKLTKEYSSSKETAWDSVSVYGKPPIGFFIPVISAFPPNPLFRWPPFTAPQRSRTLFNKLPSTQIWSFSRKIDRKEAPWKRITPRLPSFAPG